MLQQPYHRSYSPRQQVRCSIYPKNIIPIKRPTLQVSPSLAISLNITIGKSTEIPIESLVLEGDTIDTIPADISSAEVDQDTASIIEQQLQTQPQMIGMISNESTLRTFHRTYFLPLSPRKPTNITTDEMFNPGGVLLHSVSTLGASRSSGASLCQLYVERRLPSAVSGNLCTQRVGQTAGASTEMWQTGGG